MFSRLTDPNKRYDFLLVFDVKDGNPNGDPDAGNLLIIALKMYHLCNSFYQSLRKIVPLIASQCTT